MRTYRILLFSIGFALAAHHANGDAARDEARRYFEEGTKKYDLGDFMGAAESYKQAYTAKRDPAILYNIAQAFRLGGNLPQALFFYRSFLRNAPTAENREEIEQRIVALEKQIAEQQRLQSAPPNTTAPAPALNEKGGSRAPETSLSSTTNLSPSPAAKSRRSRAWIGGVVAGVVVIGIAVGVGVGVGLSGNGAPNAPHGPYPIY